VIEHLPSKHKALNSNSSIEKNEGRKKERREGGKRGEGGEATILKALISTPRTTRRKKKKPL
jgi:hypothetical protein